MFQRSNSAAERIKVFGRQLGQILGLDANDGMTIGL
jgi:hypothetical protein